MVTGRLAWQLTVSAPASGGGLSVKTEEMLIPEKFLSVTKFHLRELDLVSMRQVSPAMITNVWQV